AAEQGWPERRPSAPASDLAGAPLGRPRRGRPERPCPHRSPTRPRHRPAVPSSAATARALPLDRAPSRAAGRLLPPAPPRVPFGAAAARALPSRHACPPTRPPLARSRRAARPPARLAAPSCREGKGREDKALAASFEI
ncbi:unnamed protein product, partial [Urochloa humidicola]